jgi:hypothetical protein
MLQKSKLSEKANFAITIIQFQLTLPQVFSWYASTTLSWAFSFVPFIPQVVLSEQFTLIRYLEKCLR